MDHGVLELLVVIAAAAMVSQWLAWRLRIPAIILLILSGLILGPFLGVIHPTQSFGSALPTLIGVAVAIILFEGGLNLHWHELREAGAGVRRLITLGLVFNLVLGSLAARYIGGLDWPVALVFGAIIVVTGPTVIMPLLRHARLRQKSAAILKWEGIVNDPVGALIAVLIYEYFTLTQSGTTGTELLISLGFSLVVAIALGVGFGYFIGKAYRRGWVPEYLKGPGIIGTAVLVYGLSNFVHEDAGLLGATILGMVVGNQKMPGIEEIRRFKEYITILLVSSLFLVLTADIDRAMLDHLNWRIIALILCVIFVVRPLAIGLATLGANMDWRDRLLAAWIAPRGIVAAAVAAAFVPGMVAAGYDQGELLVPMIFGLILATVILHGSSVGWMARKLGIASTKTNGLLIVGAYPWMVDLAKQLQSLEVPVRIVDSSWHRLRQVRLEGLPYYYGHLISEQSENNLEINDIGYLLAATDNDAYNALICAWFASDLSRSSVFQLPSVHDPKSDDRRMIRDVRGRQAFADDAFHEELMSRYYQGWRFHKTRLTDSYDYERYLQDSKNTCLAQMLVRSNGNLVLRFNENTKPESGDVMINFMPERTMQADESGSVEIKKEGQQRQENQPDQSSEA